MRSLYLSLSFLAACAGAMDAPTLSPPPAGLTLAVGTPVVGEPLRLTVRGALPGDEILFGRGAPGAGPCLGVGVCLDLRQPVLLGTAFADGAGQATLEVLLPEAVPVGARLVVQAARRVAPAVSPSVERVVVGRFAPFGVWSTVVGDVEIEHHEVRGALGTFAVLGFDEVARHVVGRNGAGTPQPGRYSRLDWEEQGGTVYVCPAVLDAPTPADALAAPRAPWGATCATGLPWGALTPVPPDLAGVWLDEWATAHEIDEQSWAQRAPFFSGDWEISRYSNLQRTIVARNAATNAFFPGDWSRFDWTEQGGDVYYCQTAYAAASEWEARSTPPADAGDLASGCAGFSWTLLTP